LITAFPPMIATHPNPDNGIGRRKLKPERYAAISVAAQQIADLLIALLAVKHQAPPRPSQQRASDEMNKPIGITAKGSQSGRRAKSMQRSPLGGMMRPNGGRPDDRATGYRR
jgi:hypothetical protein